MFKVNLIVQNDNKEDLKVVFGAIKDKVIKGKKKAE